MIRDRRGFQGLEETANALPATFDLMPITIDPGHIGRQLPKATTNPNVLVRIVVPVPVAADEIDVFTLRLIYRW